MISGVQQILGTKCRGKRKRQTALVDPVGHIYTTIIKVLKQKLCWGKEP